MFKELLGNTDKNLVESKTLPMKKKFEKELKVRMENYTKKIYKAMRWYMVNPDGEPFKQSINIVEDYGQLGKNALYVSSSIVWESSYGITVSFAFNWVFDEKSLEVIRKESQVKSYVTTEYWEPSITNDETDFVQVGRINKEIVRAGNAMAKVIKKNFEKEIG